MDNIFKIQYLNKDSQSNEKYFFVKEHSAFPDHYLIVSEKPGEPQVGGGRLAKKYCSKID